MLDNPFYWNGTSNLIIEICGGDNVADYTKNAKGFTVYSVSLDKSKESWVAAIAKDKLSWEYHVSDLGYWQSQAARLYNVNSIPTNFLLDAEKRT